MHQDIMLLGWEATSTLWWSCAQWLVNINIRSMMASLVDDNAA